MNVSVIIPAYNEEKRLPVTFEALEAYRRSPSAKAVIGEVIVVDDGSADGTAHVAREWRDRLPVTVISHERNRGKGAAVRTGMLKATSDYALLYDADGATPIDELDACETEIRKSDPDIIIGSRLDQLPTKKVKMRWYRRLIGRSYHAVTNGLIPGIGDAACGFKLFKKHVAEDLFSRQRIERFAYDIEILSYALQRGYRVLELPVRWTAIPGSKVNLVSDSWNMFWSVVGLYLRRTSWGEKRATK